MKLNLPNKLTLMRMALIPLVMLLLLEIPFWPAQIRFIHSLFGQIAALVLFVIASLTDFFDGRIARSRNLVTNFGKFTDPLADKMLVLSVLLAFVARGRVHAFVFFVILARELIITGLRQVALEKRQVIAASWWGKAKTTVQLFALIFLMLEGILGHFFVERVGDSAPRLLALYVVTDLLIAIAVILAIISAYDYFRKNRSVLRDDA